MSNDNRCFCGSLQAFAQCCYPFIKQTKQPITAEQLMRSRFSAYASQSYQYIVDTYAAAQRKSLTLADITEASRGCHWFALVVYDSNKGEQNSDNEQQHFVEFSAYYIVDDCLFEMREKSRFILEASHLADDESTKNNKNSRKQWRYLDGNIIKHSELCKISRKQICPCNQYPTAWSRNKNKKYKQCCAR